MAENKNAETEIAIEVVDKEKRIKPIEKASQILESFGPFQIYCVILFCPVIIFFGMTIFIPIFLNIVPDHQCQQSISDNTVSSSMRLRIKKGGKCLFYKQIKFLNIFQFFTCIVMQEASDALSKLQTVTLFRPIFKKYSFKKYSKKNIKFSQKYIKLYAKYRVNTVGCSKEAIHPI